MLLTIPLLLALAAAADSSVPQYTIQTVAGSDVSGDNNLGPTVPLLQPEGVALDRAGNVYFADAADNRIRRLATYGTIQTVAGTGRPGFSGDGAAATAAQLNQPYGIALDQAGNLYVADLGNARVRRIDTHGIITTVAGGGTTLPLPFTAGMDALAAQLLSPRNVAAAPDGSLYISDFDGQRVYRLDTGGTLTIVTGTGTKGFLGDNGAAVRAQVAYPAGLAAGADGTLYVADSGNGRVRAIADGVITTVAQAPQVVDVALNAGSLYVAAAGMLGNPDSPIPGSDQISPRALALNGAGNVVFSNGNLVRVADPAGDYMTIAGLTGPASWGDGGAATSARFAAPAGCAIDAAGNLYIADTGENRIREVTAAGVVSTAYGTGDPAMLNGPRSVALAADGSLLIADTGNGRVLKIGSSGTVTTLLDKLSAPSYLFVDADGDLYIAETGGNRVTLLEAGGTTKFLAVTQPVAVVRDGQGNLYIAQSGTAQLLYFDATGWGTEVGTGLGQPSGLAMDVSGNVLVADSAHNSVVSVSPSGAVSTLAGTGAAGFAGDGGPAASALLSGPADVKVDGQGRIYVVDAGNNRIRLLAPPNSVSDLSTLRVVSAASLAPGPISPDEMVSLIGVFNPSSVAVQIGGQAATLFYAGPTQVNVLTPHTMSVGAPVTITVLDNGVADQAATVATASATPALFTLAGGAGQAAALNLTDGAANSAAQPCARGDAVLLYGTGYGPGAVVVTIGGEAATVLSAGPAPDYPGLMQVSAQVPAGLAYTGNVAVVVSIGEALSQGGVTIAVR